MPIALVTAVNIASAILDIYNQVNSGPLSEEAGTAAANKLLMGLHDAITQWKAIESQLAASAQSAAAGTQAEGTNPVSNPPA